MKDRNRTEVTGRRGKKRKQLLGDRRKRKDIGNWTRKN